MLSLLVKRSIFLIPTLLIISIVSFIIMQLPPGDLLTLLQARAMESGIVYDMDLLNYLREMYHLDRPVYIQYFYWIKAIIFHGDFGYSLMLNEEVSTLIWERLGNTLALTLFTVALSLLVGIAIGVYSAIKQYSIGDYFFTTLGFIGISFPNFFLALVLMYISLVYFKSTSLSGFFSNEYFDAPWSIAKLLDLLNHLWIPIIVIATARTARIIRVVRANLLDVLREQYIMTARSKGLQENAVIYKHALRNAINPLISIVGMQFPSYLAGATVTSIVLGLPTAGNLLYRSLIGQDMQVSAAIILLMSMVLILGNLLADIALAYTDPRIRYD